MGTSENNGGQASSSLESSVSDSTPSPSSSPPSTQQPPERRKRKRSGRSSRLEKTVLVMVLMFVANSINGKKIMKSINDQFAELQADYYSSYSSSANGGDQPRNSAENRTEDTAVIITSSSIPSNPSTYMIDTVLNSTRKHLKGLSPTAPVLITIDHFRFSDFGGLPPVLSEKIDKLEEYTVNLLNEHMSDPNVHVIPGMRQNHIGGSVVKAMNLIERHYPTVKYLYYLQHDFFFVRDIDHTGLIKLMDEKGDEVNWVRFPKRAPHQISRSCGDKRPIKYNRTVHDDGGDSDGTPPAEGSAGTFELAPTSSYSDNNHLTRLSWYKPIILSLIKLNRAPEDPLQRRANSGCMGLNRADNIHGLWLYNELTIQHLDGRHTEKVPT